MIKYKKQTLQVKISSSHRQCHGKVHGVDYCTSLFSVSYRPLHDIKQLRLLQFLIWGKLSSMPQLS